MASEDDEDDDDEVPSSIEDDDENDEAESDLLADSVSDCRSAAKVSATVAPLLEAVDPRSASLPTLDSDVVAAGVNEGEGSTLSVGAGTAGFSICSPNASHRITSHHITSHHNKKRKDTTDSTVLIDETVHPALHSSQTHR